MLNVNITLRELYDQVMQKWLNNEIQLVWVNHVLEILYVQCWANLILRVQLKIVRPIEHTENEQEKSMFTSDEEAARNIAFCSWLLKYGLQISFYSVCFNSFYNDVSMSKVR